jgi:hypothetical protein
MRRPSRRGSPLAAPARKYFANIFIPHFIPQKMRRLNRRGPPHAAPAQGFIYIFCGEAAPHYLYFDFL